MLKKLKREIFNFLYLFFIMGIAVSPIFSLKIIDILYKRGLSEMVATAISLTLFVLFFVLFCVVAVKPWKKNKKLAN